MAHTNQSESASFVFLLFPLIALAFVRFVKSKHIDSVAVSLLLFIAFALFYQYVGLPKFLTEMTLWGRTTPKRATISLGLAQVLLLGYLISDRLNHQSNPSTRRNAVPSAIFLATSSLTIYLLTKLPAEWRSISGYYAAVMVGAGFFMLASYALCLERYKLLVGALLIWNILIALAFNPISVAPSYFNVSRSNGDTTEFLKNQRVLSLGARFPLPAMMLMAAGVPVMNGVFFYPQKTLWKILDPSGKHVSVYNRYQHLTFPLLNTWKPEPTALIRAPSQDAVSVAINGTSFDFSSLPTDYVISGKNYGPVLLKNRTLEYVKQVNGNLIFRVIRAREMRLPHGYSTGSDAAYR